VGEGKDIGDIDDTTISEEEGRGEILYTREKLRHQLSINPIRLKKMRR
jgi:hypothetical protein